MEKDSILRPMIMFGGKGGVGKTTCSAAVALHLASSGHKTLIITSDATPSLSDIFEGEIGDTIKAVGERLDAVEISADAILFPISSTLRAWTMSCATSFWTTSVPRLP